MKAASTLSPDDPVFLHLSETLDALVTITLGFRDSPRSELAGLYAAARVHSGGGPVTYAMAVELLKATEFNSTVIIASGEYEPSGYVNGESDGPLGAAALARALRGLGRRIVLCHDPKLTAAHHAVIDEFVCEALPVAEYPGGADFDYRKHSEAILAAHDPAALISVEKLGRNRAGLYHAANGRGGFDADENRVDDLFDLAGEHNLLTLSFGDYGNEIGFGAIYQAACELSPHGKGCACPCRQGIIATTLTTHVLPCTVSNWGAMAVADALAAVTGRLDLIHTAEHEERLLDLAVKAGMVDGALTQVRRSVDGVPGEADVALIRLMSEAARRAPQTKADYFNETAEHFP
jgi:hypothetical protein